MGQAVGIFISLVFLSGGFLAAGWLLSLRLTAQSNRQQQFRWLAKWFLKGTMLPLVLWVVMNLGISWQLQPFMPSVQAARNSGTGWVPEFLRVIGEGLFVLTSYWAALTLGWGLMKA